MKIKIFGFNLIHVLILCSLSLTAAHAATALSPKQIKGGLVPSFVFSDPAISTITSTKCVCKLPDRLDAMVMAGGVRVKMFNHGTLKATIKLKLTWHDIVAGRIMTKFKNTFIDGRKYKTVVITTDPILAKKSVGVTVEIIPISPTDKNTANNKQTVRKCEIRYVE